MDFLDVLIDEAQVRTRACDAIEILPLASALLCPATGGYRTGGLARQGFMPTKALPCHLGLSIAADHNHLAPKAVLR